MEDLVLGLFSGFMGALFSALLTLWIKGKIDLGKAIRYLHAEVKGNLGTYDLNQEILKGFAGGKYTAGKTILPPFHDSAWQTLKAQGYLLNLGKKLQNDLENLYLEIEYENRVISDPNYLTSGANAVELRDRMADIIPDLLKTVEQELRKKIDP